MSTNTILASAPLTSTGYHLKANGTTLGNSLIWDNGTNVGIGNTNTSYTLDVSGTAKVSGITSLTSATASTSTSTGALVVTGGFGIGGALFGTSAVFNHNDAPTIKIQRSGGTDTNTALEFTNASRSFFIGSNGTTMGLGGTSGSIASQPLQITSAGNVGIGTSSPSSPLSISTNVSSSALSLEVSNSGTYGLIGVRRGTQTGASAGINYYTTTAQKWFTGIYEGSDNFGFYSVAYAGFPMVITTGGNVGIGTSSPSCRLEIAGGYVSLNDNAIRWRFASDANHATVFTATYNGPIMYGYSGAALGYQGIGVIWTNSTSAYNYNNSTTWQQTSDIRIKENIRPITGALSKICSLNPTHFEYKNKLGKTKTGFIAQEFEQVFEGHVIESEPLPEYQEYFAEGEKIKSIDADLIPYLVKAIQEQNQTIQNLQEQINILAK